MGNCYSNRKINDKKINDKKIYMIKNKESRLKSKNNNYHKDIDFVNCQPCKST